MITLRADEQARVDLVEAGQAVLANQSKDKALIAWAYKKGLAVRIDRKSNLGNPFVLGKDGDRDAVCDSYNGHIDSDEKLLKEARGLAGKVLLCWCYPKRCHGETILAILEQDRLEG